MNTALVLPTKEVEQTNKQVVSFQNQANDLQLKTPEDMETAASLLEHIKEAEKVIVGRKEEITRPFMQGLASVRDLFKPIELGLKNAKEVAKAKVVQYQNIEAQRIEDAKAKILARAEKGTLRTDTAVQKLAEVGEVVTRSGKMKTQMRTKVRIIDETLIPREFLVPDMQKITAAVLHTDIVIPGIEKYKERVIAV